MSESKLASDAASGVRQPSWDCKPSTFAHFEDKMTNYLVRAATLYVIPELNVNIQYPEPAGAQAVRDREVKIARAKTWVFLSDSVSPSDGDDIIEQYNEGKQPNDRINMDPVKLWAAMKQYARGAVPDLSGANLMREINQFQWPASAGDGSLKCQVKEAVSMLRSFLQQAELIQDAQYPFTQAMACMKFRDSMPDRLQSNYASYEQLTKLHDVEKRGIIDADRHDRAFIATQQKVLIAKSDSNAQSISEPDMSTTQMLKILIASMNNNSGKRAPKKISEERRRDKSAGPIDDTSKWCDKHGWVRHDSANCRQLKNTEVAKSNVVRCVKNADGTYTEINTVMVTKVLNAMADSGQLSECSDEIFIDSGAEFSLCNSITDMVNVKMVRGPLIDGVSEGSPIQTTHRGYRPIRMNSVEYLEPCWFAPNNKFNISSTEVLASLGVSTWVDATTSNNQMSLIPLDKKPVLCDKIGNIWTMPKAAQNRVNDGDLLDDIDDDNEWCIVGKRGKVMTTIDPADKKRPDKQMQYSTFRKQLGSPSHVATMRVANKMHVKLTNVDESRAAMDSAMQIVNQSARPLVKIDESVLEPVATKIIVSDTVGSQFPKSHRGNTVMQTWTLLSDPAVHYVTVGPNHSAQTSCMGLQQFALESGTVLHSDMINSGVTLATDGGREYLGTFSDKLQRAGIYHTTSTAYKKSGYTPVAESANNRAQQRMRMNMNIAHANFTSFGLDVNEFWDSAAQYGAKQDRARHRAIAGSFSYVAMTRTIPAPFGSVGSITLQSTSPTRAQQHKQLTNRAVRGLLLDTIDHKCIMVLSNGKIMTSSDVNFNLNTSHMDNDNKVAQLRASDTVANRVQNATLTTPQRKAVEINAHEHSAITGGATQHAIHDAENATITANNDTICGGAPTHGSDNDEHNLRDIDGVRVNTGDDVSIYWPAEDTVYNATITGVQNDDGTYTVTYPESPQEYIHLINESTPMNLRKRTGTVLISRLFSPNELVKQYLTVAGDIIPELLSGKRQLPQCPELPAMTQANSPSVPNTIKQAMESPQAIYWLHSIINEYVGHVKPEQRHPTFHYTQRKKQGRQLNTKWVFTLKFNGDELIKFKSRMCIAGWGMQQGVDFVENYTGTAPIGDLYLLESVAVKYDMNTYEDDITQAYCHEKMPLTPSGETVTAMPAQGVRTFTEDGVLLQLEFDMALYGHPASGYALARGIHNRMINRNLLPGQAPCPIKLVQCPSQPVIFRAEFDKQSQFHGGFFAVWINNDNIRTYVSKNLAPAYQQFRSWLSTAYTITGTGKCLQESEPQTCLGVEIKYEERKTTISMPAYIAKAIEAAGMSQCNPAPTPMIEGFQLNKDMGPTTDTERDEVRKHVNKAFKNPILQQHGRELLTWPEVVSYYAQHVSTIGWIAKQVGVVITLAHSILGRSMSNPCQEAFNAVKRVYRYLNGHKNMALTYSTSKILKYGEEMIETAMQSDSSLADDHSDCKSQGGMTGGIKGMTPCYYGSSKSKRLHTCTAEAETHHGCRASKQGIYMGQLVAFLGVTDGIQPVLLELDNLAVVCTSGSSIRKFTPKQKHYHIDDKFLMQCVEEGTIIVKHTPGTPKSFTGDDPGFPVDALTKPLGAQLLQYYYPALQGRVDGFD